MRLIAQLCPDVKEKVEPVIQLNVPSHGGT